MWARVATVLGSEPPGDAPGHRRLGEPIGFIATDDHQVGFLSGAAQCGHHVGHDDLPKHHRPTSWRQVARPTCRASRPLSLGTT